jgi:ABC-type Fe3+/spermidine/putrescine transport system ATPase subunit
VLALEGLTKRYGDEVVLDDLSLTVEDGEFVTILGPSGAGKTTALLAVAGHVAPSAGRITIDGVEVSERPPDERPLGVVFQRGALFPHMSVEENLDYALAAADDAPEPTSGAREETVRDRLDLVGMTEHAEKRPDQLSGGQRRRVELARAVVADPELLLLDEPLTGLDRGLRVEMRREIARIHDATDATTLYVTHDQEEALSLSDRIVVMRDGRAVARGAPAALHDRPPSPFVARFLGDANRLAARAASGDAVAWHGHRLELGDADRPQQSDGARADDGASADDETAIYVRPSAVAMDPVDRDVTATGAVVDREYRGAATQLTVALDDGEERLRASRRDADGLRVGDETTVGFDADDATVFVDGRRRRVVDVALASAG